MIISSIWPDTAIFKIRYPAGYPASQIRYPARYRIGNKKGRIIQLAGYPDHPYVL
jgi:hypothetical protein